MNSPRCSLLVVDDDPAVLVALTVNLAEEFEVLTADSAEAAREICSRRPIDLVLTDQRLPGLTGVQLLEWVKEHSPRTARLLMTGLTNFEDAVDAINFGQVSRYLLKPWRVEELLQVLRIAAHTYQLERSHEGLLGELQKLNLKLEERVRQRTQELEEANQQLRQKTWMLEKLALTDPLTRLPNRRAMDRLARAELKRHNRYQAPLALGIIDVDNFKEVNRLSLLTGGDHVLSEVARTFEGSVRTVDTVGRIGGDEFLVVAPETDRGGAVVLGERVRGAVEKMRIDYNGRAITVTVSVGIAVADASTSADYNAMKHVAAAALAEAKANGRNRSVIRAVDSALEEVR